MSIILVQAPVGHLPTVFLRRVATSGVLGAALLLGACAQQGGNFDLGLGLDEPKTTDMATATAGPMSTAELEKATGYWGKRNAENPRDGKAALAYARNLKALDRKAEALAVLQGSYMFNADDRDFLSEYGRLALQQGQVSTAEKLLARADDPAKPDWRVLSARGTALARQSKFKDAIPFFERAQRLAPDKSSVLNNLAMAYTMDGQAARGEALLRDATRASGPQDPRVKQNLALVLDLQGKKDEARRIENGGPTDQPAMVAPPQLKPSRVDMGVLPDANPPVVKASATAVDADAVIRAAMEAESAKRR